MGKQNQVEWIRCGPETQGYGVSKSDRVKIRRQAMAKVGTERRKRGNYGQANRGQYPVFEGAVDSKPGTAESEQKPEALGSSDPYRGTQSGPVGCRRHMSQSIPATMPLSEWERATTVNGFNVLCIAVPGLELFVDSPDQLVSQLRQPKSSFLKYIPARYGSSPCLDHAVQAFVCKMREMLGAGDSKLRMGTLSHYGKALRAIQTAIGERTAGLQTDVLCSIDLLSLIEVRHLNHRVVTHL